MSAVPRSRTLVVLRRRLTVWYVATLGAILLLLGAGLFATIHRQITQQLDDSLRDAVAELIRAARIREVERRMTRGVVADAVTELHIPDRQLYLVDTLGVPLTPRVANEAVRAVARRAAQGRAVFDETDTEAGHTLSLYAERFRLRSGAVLVAVAAVDQLELTDQYMNLIVAFVGAAAAALVLVAAGGSLLARKSTAPVERSMEYMRRFMADAAHELRTPIAVLRTRAEVALQGEYSASGCADTLRAMAAEAERLGHVVDELLLLARAESGERPVARERFYLDDVAIEAALPLRALAHARGVTLQLDEFEATAVHGDAALVRELVNVLLDNAIKFTAAGGRVGVRVSPGPVPTIVVEDTGCGIAPEALPHVFERFYRGDSARSRAGGAGLGLSIAQWIAEAHGARITLESTPGVGTRATVRFPQPEAAAGAGG